MRYSFPIAVALAAATLAASPDAGSAAEFRLASLPTSQPLYTKLFRAASPKSRKRYALSSPRAWSRWGNVRRRKLVRRAYVATHPAWWRERQLDRRFPADPVVVAWYRELASCESGHRQDAVSPNGLYHSFSQWRLDTWRAARDRFWPSGPNDPKLVSYRIQRWISHKWGQVTIPRKQWPVCHPKAVREIGASPF